MKDGHEPVEVMKERLKRISRVRARFTRPRRVRRARKPFRKAERLRARLLLLLVVIRFRFVEDFRDDLFAGGCAARDELFGFFRKLRAPRWTLNARQWLQPRTKRIQEIAFRRNYEHERRSRGRLLEKLQHRILRFVEKAVRGDDEKLSVARKRRKLRFRRDPPRVIHRKEPMPLEEHVGIPDWSKAKLALAEGERGRYSLLPLSREKIRLRHPLKYTRFDLPQEHGIFSLKPNGEFPMHIPALALAALLSGGQALASLCGQSAGAMSKDNQSERFASDVMTHMTSCGQEASARYGYYNVDAIISCLNVASGSASKISAHAPRPIRVMLRCEAGTGGKAQVIATLLHPSGIMVTTTVNNMADCRTAEEEVANGDL